MKKAVAGQTPAGTEPTRAVRACTCTCAPWSGDRVTSPKETCRKAAGDLSSSKVSRHMHGRRAFVVRPIKLGLGAARCPRSSTLAP
jgi:hypothetical protein